jgi:membrane protein implicated in regulation of membrane protease activity
MAGVWNIVIGLAAVAAGLSGRFTLIGTSGTTGQVLLVAIGATFAGFGVYQFVRAKKQKQG